MEIVYILANVRQFNIANSDLFFYYYFYFLPTRVVATLNNEGRLCFRLVCVCVSTWFVFPLGANVRSVLT